MVAHKKHAFVCAQEVRHPFTFLIVERHAVVIAVIGNATIEAAGVLVKHQKLKILQTSQRGGIGHVRVQNAARLRQMLMQMRV